MRVYEIARQLNIPSFDVIYCCQMHLGMGDMIRSASSSMPGFMAQTFIDWYYGLIGETF